MMRAKFGMWLSGFNELDPGSKASFTVDHNKPGVLLMCLK